MVAIKVIASIIMVLGLKTFVVLATARFFQGTAQISLMVIGTSLVAQIYKGQRGEKINSVAQFAICAGVLLGFYVPQISNSLGLDWPTTIAVLEGMVGLVQVVALRLVWSIPVQESQEGQQESVSELKQVPMFLRIATPIWFALLAGIAQQLVINGLLTYPQYILSGLSGAQGWIANGGWVALLGAGVGAGLGTFMKRPYVQLLLMMVLEAASVAAFGAGYVFHHPMVVLVGYMAFVLTYNAGIGALAAPLFQRVQLPWTRGTSEGVFTFSTSLTAAAFAYFWLPGLQHAPGVLFTISVVMVTAVMLTMLLMPRSQATESEQSS